MSLLFFCFIGTIVLGGICLWFSGHTAGLYSSDDTALDSQTKQMEKKLNTMDTELVRLKDELTLTNKENSSLKHTVDKQANEIISISTPQQIPAPTVKETTDAADEALAKLDLERVAHRKTKSELDRKQGEFEALKNLALSVKMQTGDNNASPAPAFGNRKGAGFQTVSIATRSNPVSGTEHDRLRQSHDRLQREKEKVESELARSQQELQLLKMRQ